MNVIDKECYTYNIMNARTSGEMDEVKWWNGWGQGNNINNFFLNSVSNGPTNLREPILFLS